MSPRSGRLRRGKHQNLAGIDVDADIPARPGPVRLPHPRLERAVEALDGDMDEIDLSEEPPGADAAVQAEAGGLETHALGADADHRVLPFRQARRGKNPDGRQDLPALAE